MVALYARRALHLVHEGVLRIPVHPIRRSGRIRSLVPEDPIRDRSGATSGMMIRLQGWDRAGA